MALTPAFLDELRARTSLSALIGKTVKLTKAGREMKGCCPFHNEKTPSFYVNDDKGFYHCFGCSAHGDAIRWMTDQRGLPFMDAVKELAATAGLEVPAPSPRDAERAERQKSLHDVMQAAADWFAQQLGGLDGADARALLDRRGVSEATRRTFGFGYAPDARGKLRAALKEFGDAMLVEAGLLISVEGKEPYDRFRGRLMIPIRDARGRVIAFGGRIIGDGEPKYLNSPDTPLFDKGRTLYNLDRALPAARKADRVFVVEGYMDAIALAQAGIGEVVAPLGTALTEAQLERLWRMVDVPLVCLDGDSAGQKAAIRAAHRALPLLQPGQSLAFVTLPEGQDPDDLIRAKGPAAFEALVKEAEPMVNRLWKHERSEAITTTPEGRAALRQRGTDHATSIANRLVQDEYKRSFNDLFYEEFGWKRQERKEIATSLHDTGPKVKPQVFQSMYRSLLYGLSRFPVVLSFSLETVAFISLPSDELLRWRETMIEAIIRHPRLDDDALQAHLTADRVSKREAIDIQTDLRFPWFVEPELAKRTLVGMAEFLHDEQDLLNEIEAYKVRLGEDLTAEDFASIHLALAGAYERKQRLYDYANHLGGGDSETDVS